MKISAHLRSDYRFEYDYVDTVSYDNQGRIKSPYMSPISIRPLFRPGRRTLRVRDSHTFTQGYADQFGGAITEVRTVDVTIRKLR